MTHLFVQLHNLNNKKEKREFYHILHSYVMFILLPFFFHQLYKHVVQIVEKFIKKVCIVERFFCTLYETYVFKVQFNSGCCKTIHIYIFVFSVQARTKSSWFVCGWFNCSTVTASVWYWQGCVWTQILEELHRYLSKPLPLLRGW